MKTTIEARDTGDGVEPKHTVHIVCASCGYDLDEAELEADTCSNCGAPLNLKQHVAIEVTTLPPISGESM
jgi:ribosomal protein L37E|tara:strand:+ start:634 stop:843 length:210 start_codon:yes stop_codon:yes gene_type:complete